MAGTGKEDCHGLPHPGSGLGGTALGIDRSEVDFDPSDCVQGQTALEFAQHRQCNSRYCDACKNMLLGVRICVIRRKRCGAFAQCCLSVSKHVKRTKKCYRA